jgi:hypothetical protein
VTLLKALAPASQPTEHAVGWLHLNQEILQGRGHRLEQQEGSGSGFGHDAPDINSKGCSRPSGRTTAEVPRTEARSSSTHCLG